MFNLMSGIAILVASVVAGLLWDRLGASSTFYTGAVFCIVALIGLTKYRNGIFFQMRLSNKNSESMRRSASIILAGEARRR
jgi:TctA family transporter